MPSRGKTTASAVSSFPPGLGGLIDSATVSSDLTVAPTLRAGRLEGEQPVARADRLIRDEHPFSAAIGCHLADDLVAVADRHFASRLGASGNDRGSGRTDFDDVKARQDGRTGLWCETGFGSVLLGGRRASL